MTMIAAGNVTYTSNKSRILGRHRMNSVKIVFGDGSLTYSTGGIPLTLAGLGMVRDIDHVIIMESNGDGLLYEWDKSANKIRILYPTQVLGTSGTSNAGLEFTANSTVVATTTTLEVTAIGW